MIEGKWFAQGADIAQPLQLRQAVLGRGRDALDEQAQQVVVYREGTPVGTARLWWYDGGFYTGDFCVLPMARGEGYGDLLVRLVLFKAMSHQAASVTLTCPSALSPFFARYGFRALEEGDPQRMRVAAEEISLGCGHCGGK